MKRLRSFLPLLILVSIGLALLASGWVDRVGPEQVAQQYADLQAMILAHPVRAGAIYAILVMLVVATGMPGSVVLILTGGMLFGVVEGTGLSLIGLVLGALILFYASRAAFASHGKPMPPLVAKLRTGYAAYPFSYTMFLRLVPFFPFGAVTVALAWLRCPPGLFLFATATGGGVALVFENALGAGLARSLEQGTPIALEMLARRDIALPLLGMAVLALGPIVLGQLRRMSRAQRPG
jgi:uncharacterized membrane protein YdjX (TVP38/TMEM64 family)